ncbi:MAG: flippase-like domain-containing protein [Anaerolineae bacterium]|nr:flippase-like domain-containing protein [Anaerolineae bacterium]
MRIEIKDLRRILPGILISLVLLVAVFWSANLGDLRDELLNANYRYLPVALVLFIISLFARAFAWRTLLEEKASIKRVFLTLTEGYFLNNVFPFRLGEIGRAFLLSRTTSLRFWQIIPTIVIERSFDMLIVVSILLASLPFVVGVEGAGEKAALVGGVVAVGLGVLYVLAHQRKRVIVLYHHLQARFPILQKIATSQIESFFEGLAVITNAGRFLKVFGWMLFAWALLIVHYYLVLLAFVPEAKLAWATFGISTVGLGIAIPSAPGGLGVVEATLVFVFGLFAVSRSKALAYSLVVHSSYLLLTSLPGMYGLMADGESLVQVYRNVRAQAQKPKPIT